MYTFIKRYQVIIGASAGTFMSLSVLNYIIKDNERIHNLNKYNNLKLIQK